MATASDSERTDARQRADENAETVRRHTLGLRALATALYGIVLAFLVCLIFAIVTKADGWANAAALVGFFGLMVEIFGIVAYYSFRDNRAILQAEGRRLQAEAIQVDSSPGNIRRARLLYRANLPVLAEQYRLKSRRLSRLHSVLQVVVIAGSLSASTLIATVSQSSYGPVFATINTLVVGLAATLANFFKLKDKSLAAQIASNGIENEAQYAELRLDAYTDLTLDESLALLITNVEKFRRDYRGRELELDQAPDAVSIDMTARGGDIRS